MTYHFCFYLFGKTITTAASSFLLHLLYYGYDHELPFEDNDQNEIDLSDRLISKTISKL